MSWNENNSETSLPERDTDDISVDLVEETDINQKTSIYSENNAGNFLGTVENAQEVESEIVEEINILAVGEVNADERRSHMKMNTYQSFPLKIHLKRLQSI